MRLVSFNILSDDYVAFQDQTFLRRYYPNLDADQLRWCHRAERVVAKMKALHADLFLLQEVMEEARATLQRRFRDFYVGPLARHQFQEDHINSNRTGNLIMIRKSLCRTQPEFDAVPLGQGYNMAVAQLTWTVPHGPCEQAVVFSLHLIDTDAKFQQVNHLLRVVDRFCACDIVLGGDFNTRSRRVHQRLERRFFSSVSLDQADLHYGTYLCKRPMIDYIYTSLPAHQAYIDNQPVNSDRRTCFIRTLEEIGSDHYPVVADV